jgi:hypothetical protein
VSCLKDLVMKKQSDPPGEDHKIRCPRLGHQITFAYCQAENQGLPCFKTLDCWFEHFLVEEYLRKKMDPEQWDKIFQNPKKPKMVSLVELIEQAKERKREGQ